MSITKNKCVRCDKCGKISNTEDGYYKKPDGGAGYINSQGFNIAQDFCDECAAVLGENALHALEPPDQHSKPQ